ncbi:MAG: ThiF family adenylyltransferase [Ardenticatenaceae bacterium]|nr:ThiF family adenylyltransferase [Anaerolineales bacterium]MCB8980602.1 ThiF family adenylyltransferase [Ardenticatenaceae bacterium]
MQLNNGDTIAVDFTPTYRALLGETEKMELYLVGTGGTGSALADALARILYHARQKGKVVNLTMIDPDVVEEKNIGRQRFCQAEVGWPKSSSLALRLNAAFGLDIRAIPKPFALDMVIGRYSASTTKKLVIGCVDHFLPRQELAKAVEVGNGHLWWLDVGNAYHNGNVFIGNHIYAKQWQADDVLRLCSGLPSPAVQNPALCLPDPPAASSLSCADLTLREEQSLMINTVMAAIAANYCYQWVLHEEITSMSTAVTLDPPTMTSQQITHELISAAFDRYQEEE